MTISCIYTVNHKISVVLHLQVEENHTCEIWGRAQKGVQKNMLILKKYVDNDSTGIPVRALSLSFLIKSILFFAILGILSPD